MDFWVILVILVNCRVRVPGEVLGCFVLSGLEVFWRCVSVCALVKWCLFGRYLGLFWVFLVVFDTINTNLCFGLFLRVSGPGSCPCAWCVVSVVGA